MSTDRTADRIVVGVDGSAGGRRAFEWALAEARVRGTAVEAVHAHRWDLPPDYIVARAGGVVRHPEEERRAATALLDAAVDDVVGDDTAVTVTREVVMGSHPAHVLVDRSKDAALLVVGSRGLGGFAGMLLGSVSQQCVHHSTCPVVVVPPEA